MARASIFIYKAKRNPIGGSRFENYFYKALADLREIQTRDEKRNKRLEGMTFLKLSELFSIHPKYMVEASLNYSLWESLASKVEHAFCHFFAQHHRKRIEDFFIITNPEMLPEGLVLANWDKKLREFLANQSVKKLAKRHIRDDTIVPDNKIERALQISLIEDLKFTNAKQLIEDHRLVERYKQLTRLDFSQDKIKW